MHQETPIQKSNSQTTLQISRSKDTNPSSNSKTGIQKTTTALTKQFAEMECARMGGVSFLVSPISICLTMAIHCSVSPSHPFFICLTMAIGGGTGIQKITTTFLHLFFLLHTMGMYSRSASELVPSQHPSFVFPEYFICT